MDIEDLNAELEVNGLPTVTVIPGMASDAVIMVAADCPTGLTPAELIERGHVVVARVGDGEDHLVLPD